MKKILTVFCAWGCFSASAQTLFTYGKQAVSADEFLRAFKKNNTGAKDEKAVRDYLDLYVASRLKIAEAKEKHLDTLPQLKTDLVNLRQQILPNYLNDKASIDALVKEAFAREQKDVHVAHIFIAFTKNNVTDTAAAIKKKNDVVNALAKGTSFSDAAKQYSDDPSAMTNGGDLGWITAFSLPYELESVVYATPAGKTSAVYTSNAGYHLFKNLGERKAIGRVKAAQILLAFPPGVDEAYKESLKRKADSLYNRLLAGDDFGKFATAYSNDVVSAASNGQMQEFGAGEYNPVFEAAVFSLPKDGAISKPFLTTHGYHIVKRIKITAPPAKLDVATADELRNRLESSDRLQVAKSVLAQKVMKQAGYKNLLPSNDKLWINTDSALNYSLPASRMTISLLTPILSVGKHEATVKDWLDYAQSHRYRASGARKTWRQLWNEFAEAQALKYYEDHLEDYNPEFKRQIAEFADGNLFFEVMQRNIWTPAQTDTVALFNYYKAHKNHYLWKQSADAVLFYVANASSADELYKKLQASPAAWRSVAANYAEQITSDSGRFELAQIPKGKEDLIGPGTVTTPVLNKADNTAAFAYVVSMHNGDETRSFADAKGLVINDYQAELEKTWVADLKKKYPVTVNEAVFKTVVAKAK